MYKWKVAPLCDAQLTDVNPKDILNDGLYRKCNTYKSGGGYDQFSSIFKHRVSDSRDYNDQFVVQLAGCPLKCPYCYVTDARVNGKFVEVTTDDLLKAFNDSGCSVFHLMGGAPALYLNHWLELIDRLDSDVAFHSDFLLIEGEYDDKVLSFLGEDAFSLFAVSVKGSSAKEFRKNTGVSFEGKEDLFWGNLSKLVNHGVGFYITYTGLSPESIESFKTQVKQRFPHDYSRILRDSFNIPIVDYNALHYKDGTK